LALLQIPLSRISLRHPDPQGHESRGWDQEHDHRLIDGPLSILRCGLGRRITHDTTLGKSRRCPPEQYLGQNRKSKFHRTPRERIRKASGKKKMVIKIRQPTTEHMVNHFIRETSYLKCMKKPMISAALITDNPISRVSMRLGAKF